jgi:hypothetical protein
MTRHIPAEGSSLSPLCRAFGLAAVAAELNLQMDTLEPETARAIERGAAALFLAGYGPRLTGSAPSARLNERWQARSARRFRKGHATRASA